jgi:hypothetical protein
VVVCALLAVVACGRVGFAPIPHVDLPGDSLPPLAAHDDVLVLDEDTTATVDVLTNDEQAAGATVRVVTSDVNLSVKVLGAGMVEVQPTANFNGSASFVYEAARGEETAQATVAVTVRPVNDAPVATDDHGTTADNVVLALPVLTNDF